MADMARKQSDRPDSVAPDGEGSSIRTSDARASVRPPQQSSHNLKPVSARRASSTRPAVPGSREARIEQKVLRASELLRDLPATDARVRLLHVAILRRDESLLDGVLAELNKPDTRG